MRFISHRGNIEGPNSLKENHPEYIREALRSNYDVQVDVWFNSGAFYLGNNAPQHKIEIDFLVNDKIWCWARNYESLERMVRYRGIHCFWSEKDLFSLTSKSFIWASPGYDASGAIIFKPEATNLMPTDPEGICSDFIKHYREDYRSKLAAELKSLE